MKVKDKLNKSTHAASLTTALPHWLEATSENMHPMYPFYLLFRCLDVSGISGFRIKSSNSS